MSEYNWMTKNQAYLAKIAGKDVGTLPTPSTKEQELLKEIAEEYVMVPAYTASDNGKVFAVNEAGNGVEWVEPSGGGGGMLKVTMTEDRESGATALDKTAGEIYAAFPFVISVEDVNGKLNTYHLKFLRFDEEYGYEISFLYGSGSSWEFYASAADDYPTDKNPSPSPT